jgi:hypothetical protein
MIILTDREQRHRFPGVSLYLTISKLVAVLQFLAIPRP